MGDFLEPRKPAMHSKDHLEEYEHMVVDRGYTLWTR